MQSGVIGLGMVGGALFEVAKERGLEILGYDIKKHNASDLFDLIQNSDLIFLCLPTPTDNSGNQDITSLRFVLSILERNKFLGPVVIKSTVLPGTCAKLQNEFPSVILVHNPEFLTERNAKKDFENQDSILISSTTRGALDFVTNFYCDLLPNACAHWSMQFEVTELAKYLHNTFLATKVAFFNEFYFLCKDYFADFDLVRTLALSQGKIGENHTLVPGPDGRLGFGGNCFLKDNAAILKDHKDKLTILQSAVESNFKVRGEM